MATTTRQPWIRRDPAAEHRAGRAASIASAIALLLGLTILGPAPRYFVVPLVLAFVGFALCRGRAKWTALLLVAASIFLCVLDLQRAQDLERWIARMKAIQEQAQGPPERDRTP